MKQQNKAYLLASLVVLFWGTIGSAFKITLRYTDFLQLVLYSSLVSIVFLFLVLLIQGRLRELSHFTGREWWHSALMGFLNPFAYYVVLIKAYDLLQAQEAVALNYIWPVTLTLLSIPILKQKIGWISVLAVLISFFGTVIIILRGNFSELNFTDPLGVGLALGSSIVWALYWIYNVKSKKEPVIKLFANFLFGGLYVLILTLLISSPVMTDGYAWLGVTYIGLFEMGITFVVWLMALRLSTTTAKVTNLIYVAPFLSLVFVHFTVGEDILVSTMVGLVFIIGGIILQRYAASIQELFKRRKGHA
ncbi:MAG: DMT family transporter [Bacteroidales bacterium]|nr:DMT family transporter [Bacteroidales bacterium]